MAVGGGNLERCMQGLPRPTPCFFMVYFPYAWASEKSLGSLLATCPMKLAQA